MIRAMKMPTTNSVTCSVDADLFDCLEDAIAFVAERGGGRVHTELVGSLLAEIVAVPHNVELVPPRGMVMKKQQPPPET